MIDHCHQRLFQKKNSPFALMAVATLIFGIGSVFCAVGDLIWLLGDMAVKLHSHHYIVFAFLAPANLLIAGSFFWLYRAIHVHLTKQERVQLRRNIVEIARFKVDNNEPVSVEGLDKQFKEELI